MNSNQESNALTKHLIELVNARATQIEWSPDYKRIQQNRVNQYIKLKSNPELVEAAKVYYRENPIEFIEDWLSTYDPRNAGTDKPAHMPFVLFPKQREFILYLKSMVDNQQSGLLEKARDMGATWCGGAFSVWLFLFSPGSSVGWGSRKESLVDAIGDPDSIFEKIRICINEVPAFFLPKGFDRDQHMSYMKIINPETGSTIRGESGDQIGRGGRKLIYFLDEAAFIERPDKVEAALGDNTRTQIMISSPNGVGNLFHRRREAGVDWDGEIHKGKTHVFVMAWDDNPLKDQQWYDERKAKAQAAVSYTHLTLPTIYSV